MDAAAVAAMTAALPYLDEPGDQDPGLSGIRATLPTDLVLIIRRSAFACRPSVHRRAQLIVALAGAGTVVVERLRFRLGPGQALQLAPWQSHHYIDFEQESIDWLMLSWIEPEPERLQGLTQRCIVLDAEAWQRLGRCVHSAMAAWQGRPTDGESACWLALLLSALHGCAGAANPPVPAPHRYPLAGKQALVRQVQELVLDWLDRPFALAELAAECGVSESHLRREYRLATGSSVGSYLREQRLQRAVRLLEQGLPVGTVADACGFSSPTGFSRAFLQRWACRPSAWRR
ncbi:MAG: helix-turn-helix domain-containing protein [Planctomycetota bacterium]